jgi:hypothetical protein
MRPSVGLVEIFASGGVCTGVIVSVTFLGRPEAGSRCEEVIVACKVSFEGFAERGLGSLPGGDESVLVRGVRACKDAACPAYDILLWGLEKTDDAELARELSEPTLFSTSPNRWSSSVGECVRLLSSMDNDALGAGDANTARCGCNLTDEPARCEPARRGPASLLPRASSVLSNGVRALESGNVTADARDMLWGDISRAARTTSASRTERWVSWKRGRRRCCGLDDKERGVGSKTQREHPSAACARKQRLGRRRRQRAQRGQRRGDETAQL